MCLAFDRSGQSSHLGVEIKELLQSLRVVLEAPADIDALQHLVVALVRGPEVGRHGLRVIELRNGRGERK